MNCNGYIIKKLKNTINYNVHNFNKYIFNNNNKNNNKNDQ